MRTNWYALLALLALSLAACDGATEAPPIDEPTPSALTLERIPDGGSLFGATIGKTSGAALSSARYGCYVSTPNVGAPSAQRYRYEGYYLNFPKSALDAAGGRKRVVMIAVGSTMLYAAEERERPTLLRMARCVIPDGVEALELLTDQALKFEQEAGAMWEGETMPTPTPNVGGVGMGKGATCIPFQLLVGYDETETWDGYRITTYDRPIFSTRWLCDSGNGGYNWTDEQPSTGDPNAGGEHTGSGGDTCGTEIAPTQDQEGLQCQDPAENTCTAELGLPPWDILDILAFFYSVYDFTKNPTWTTFGWAVADGVCAALPVVPSTGLVRHAARLAARGDKVSEVAKIISEGHAYQKHVIDRGEFPGMSRADYASLIERIIKNPSATKQLERGRVGYWDDATGTVVVFSPGDVDLGSAFKPGNGRSYFDTELL